MKRRIRSVFKNISPDSSTFKTCILHSDEVLICQHVMKLICAGNTAVSLFLVFFCFCFFFVCFLLPALQFFSPAVSTCKMSVTPLKDKHMLWVFILGIMWYPF